MIYLDNAATTKPNSQAIQFAERYLIDFYNPSALYKKGIEVKEFLDNARQNVLSHVSASGYDCVFTSGGTEADNTAVFSFAKRGNAVTTLGEHSAIFEPFKQLSSRGVEARFALINKDGSVNVDDLLKKIDDKTTFVSVVHVNNETGAINDINDISAKVKKINPKVVFHSDGVQAYGKIAYRLSKSVDLYSISAHKIGGLKGTGALIKRTDLHLQPLLFGGGQESGLRSGTENVFGIAVFDKACQIKFNNLKENYEKYSKLKDLFIKEVDGYVKVLSSEEGSPYVVTVSAEGLKGEILQHLLEKEGVIVGTGSACSSRHNHSRILTECGYSNSILDGVLRISFGHDTKETEVLIATEKLKNAISTLKKVIR